MADDCLFLAAFDRLWLMQHAPLALFVFAFGACVGSFLNVVIYRLPEGMSVISPPSRCPRCGERLRFFSDNLPILGWILLRGKCRYCKSRISPQYMVIELFVAGLFLFFYLVLYTVSPSTEWWGQIGGSWWYAHQLFGSWTSSNFGSWPLFVALLFMIGGLLAMTVIDARTFTIPMAIPLFVTFVAFVAHPIQVLLPGRFVGTQTYAIPCLGWAGTLAAVGGMIGVLASLVLMRVGVFRPSFHDYDDYVKEGETLADYPHARREMMIEIAYLAPCVVLVILGAWLGGRIAGTPPEIVQAIGASFAGYLVGGGIVWAIRILGSLAFGREAMGLGDVHLLAAVGAVVGWFDPILIFFLAPFFGLLWALLSKGFSVVLRRAFQPLPYGPHLALATVVLIVCRPGVETLWSVWFAALPMPQPGFVP